MTMTLDSLLTVKEVAEMLRISPQTLYRMVRQGTIAGVKIGSQWRFDHEQLRRRLAGSAPAAPEGER